MQYRPDGWYNPHPNINSGLSTNDFCYSQYDLHEAFEAGADAMLEMLKKDGCYAKASEDFTVVVRSDEEKAKELDLYNVDDFIERMTNHGNGHLVFIPDT